MVEQAPGKGREFHQSISSGPDLDVAGAHEQTAAAKDFAGQSEGRFVVPPPISRLMIGSSGCCREKPPQLPMKARQDARHGSWALATS